MKERRNHYRGQTEAANQLISEMQGDNETLFQQVTSLGE